MRVSAENYFENEYGAVECTIPAADWQAADAAEIALVRPVVIGDLTITEVTAKRLKWKTIRETEILKGQAKLDAWIKRQCGLVPSQVDALDALDVLLLSRIFDSFQAPVQAPKTGAAA